MNYTITTILSDIIHKYYFRPECIDQVV